MRRIVLFFSLVGASAFAACADAPSPDVAAENRAALEPCTDASGSSAGGAAGTSGTAGASLGGSAGIGGGGISGSGGAFVPDPPYVAPAHDGNLIHVRNECSFALWLHGEGGGGVLMPDSQKLEAGGTYDYNRGDWPFAFIDAFLDGPGQNPIARAELTLFPGSYLSYRLDYIDGIGLPMQLEAVGPGADCKPVGCYVPQAQIMAQCPDGLLSGKRCLSPGQYCKDAANTAKPVCHALDASVAACAAGTPGCIDVAGATTADAYNCDRSFGDKPQLCAAINRGVLAAPETTTAATFYGASTPHNAYAAWLHAICPGLQAFPYDDYGVPDSFHTCIDADGGTQLNITFCPAG
jgi:hypothetical protein